eukprot:1918889-Rhodomonas_salina.2
MRRVPRTPDVSRHCTRVSEIHSVSSQPDPNDPPASVYTRRAKPPPLSVMLVDPVPGLFARSTELT